MSLRQLNPINAPSLFRKPTLPFRNVDLVPAHHSLDHHTLQVVRPVLETVAPLPKPLSTTVVGGFLTWQEFVPELHSDLIVGEGEELFAEGVVGFVFPFIDQEGRYLVVPNIIF